MWPYAQPISNRSDAVLLTAAGRECSALGRFTASSSGGTTPRRRALLWMAPPAALAGVAVLIPFARDGRATRARGTSRRRKTEIQ